MRLFLLLAGIMVREIHADQTVTDGYTAETVTYNYGYDFQDTTVTQLQVSLIFVLVASQLLKSRVMRTLQLNLQVGIFHPNQ